jgi:hypothetical protein
MGFLDKAKAQAQQLATKGQEKFEQTQAKRKEVALLRDLGAAVYAQKSGKGTPETDAEIERLVGELRAHESEHGAIDTKPTADTEAGGGGAGTASEGGEFNLDDV